MSCRAKCLLSVAVIVCLQPAGGWVRAAELEAASTAAAAQGQTQEAEEPSPAAGFGQRAARCGGALAFDGERLLIGCPDYDSPAGADTGAAFVFVRDGAAWALEARLLASDAAPAPARPGSVLLPAGFGSSVSLSGEVAVVGALFDDHAGGTDAGAAYVFVRAGSTWTEQQKLIAADAAADDRFGVAVSVAGETVVVGAFRADHAGGVDAGAAYVFVRSDESWTQQQKLVAEADPTARDNFGVAVAAAGDTVIVGARHDDPAGREDAGAAHVFVRAGTTWSPQQLLVAADGAPKDRFGSSVSLSGDTAVVGAAGNDQGGQDAGAAYVFVRARGKWAQQQKLVALDAAADDGFGHEVSVARDTVLVGALRAGDVAAMDAGAAYIFVRTDNRWVEQQKLMAADPAEEDRLGAAVALSGDHAAIGAFLDDHDGIDAGSTYVFARTGSRWSQQYKVVARSAPVGPRPAITAADREGSRVTLQVLREVGLAMMDWATASERDPRGGTAPAKAAPAGTNWSQCPPISHQELGPMLAGFLDGELPRQDGWGHPLEFCLDREGGMSFGTGVRSPGRDGRFEGADYARLGKFDPLDVDRDIVWLDSVFVVWPQN